LRFFAQTAASFRKKLIKTLVFEKSANVLAENWQKSPKILNRTTTTVPSLLDFLSKSEIQNGKRQNPNCKHYKAGITNWPILCTYPNLTQLSYYLGM
jgi:hypothetical protein